MKAILLTSCAALFALSFVPTSARADEGMWPFNKPPTKQLKSRYGFDITAERPPHFAFGGGRHHCLGHFVARRDMTEALALLARRLPSPTHDGPAEWLPDSGNTGPVSLPIRFGSEQ